MRAITWVLQDAPDVPPGLVSVLIGLANHAGPDGRGSWPTTATLARYARKTVRQVQLDLRKLESLGLIRRGDQGLVADLRADRRPTVWDLVMEVSGVNPGSPGEGGDGVKQGSPRTGPGGVKSGSPRGTPDEVKPDSPRTGDGVNSTSPRAGRTTLHPVVGRTAQEPPPGRGTGRNGFHPEPSTTTEETSLRSVSPADANTSAPAPALTVNQRANALARAYHQVQPMCRFPAIAGIARTAIQAGHPDTEIRDALLRLAAEGRSVTVETLRVELEGLPPSRAAPARSRPSTTDQRVADANRVVELFEAREHGRELPR